jgi:hypothetical protein
MKLPRHATGFRRRKIKQSIGDIEEEKPEGTTSVSIALFSSRMLRQSASGILDTREAYLVSVVRSRIRTFHERRGRHPATAADRAQHQRRESVGQMF